MSSFYQRYQALIAQGELRPDADQQACAERLARLQEELETVPPRGSLLWRTFGKKPQPPKGVYMWGGVGRGKSMLMDLFYENLAIKRKKRAHFHEFMLDVHARIRDERKKELGDPILPVAAALASEARFLAFDEMVVNNSADAMIMSRLFTALVEAGVTIVTTSNRPPADLYKDGLNREHFLPFIELLKTRLEVVSLNGPTDYRRERLGDVDLWHVPNGEAATQAMRDAFFRLTDYSPDDADNVPSEELAVPGGRTLHVPKSLKGVAVFSFKRLCAEARGAQDYLTIARHFHTVIVVGIPQLSRDNRNEAARFVTLIDALYEYKVKLLASAEAEPDMLYPEGDGSFEFERTASRLIEMQSEAYLALGHGEDSKMR
ncbi:cell division protein ZapE [Parasphingorhabdus sp.]|uniref:cell division protein ZapE n=1 Tax=Parasphingorhabdus sp. TaxID=2709688 RepID=UPI00359327B7